MSKGKHDEVKGQKKELINEQKNANINKRKSEKKLIKYTRKNIMCIRLSSLVWLLYCAVVRYFDVSEDRTVSIYRVTQLVCVDVEVTRKKKKFSGKREDFR